MNQKAFIFFFLILASIFPCSCQTKKSNNTTKEKALKEDISTKSITQFLKEKRVNKIAVKHKDFSFLELEGKKIHYRDEGNGPTIVLIHGMGSNLTQWNHYTDYFKASFRVISLDLPGGKYGKSEKMLKFGNTDNLAVFLNKFLTTLSVKDAHIIGSSYGGAVGFKFAANFNKKVKSLILIAPAVRINNPLTKKIKNPTLIIWGDKDSLLPVKQAYQLNKVIKNSILKIYEGGPHVPIKNTYARRSIKDIEDFISDIKK